MFCGFVEGIPTHQARVRALESDPGKRNFVALPKRH